MRNSRRQDHSPSLTICIKLGTSSIVSEDTFQPKLSILAAIAETICHLRSQGHRVVLVSSGAIGMGLKRMNMTKRPKALAEKQALAAVGQGRLIALYDTLFGELGLPIAQVLLTRNDISERSRYINATKTLNALLAMGVLPIVNENDTVAVQEIKFGDNDTLSAIAASMVIADYLFLLTDVDCLYTENPRRSPAARAVHIVRDIEALRAQVSTSTLGSALGTGGMETKLIAAELATGAGVTTVITHSHKPQNMVEIISQQTASVLPDGSHLEVVTLYTSSELQSGPLYTLFLSNCTPIPDRRWWIMHGLTPRGRLVIDQGAYKAIFRKRSHEREGEMEGNGGRLLAAGVVLVEGTFAAGQAVRIAVRQSACTQSDGLNSLESSTEDIRLSASESDAIIEVGRGLANYNWQEIDRIKGHKSSEIEHILGYMEREHVVESITKSRTL